MRPLVAVLISAAAAACGDSESFTIEGTVEGNPTMNLRFIYSSDRTVIKGLTAVRDGKFEYKGAVHDPSIIEILDNDYRPLGRLFVANGDRITCNLTRNNPNVLKVSGSDISERWANFLGDNAEAMSSSQSNATIERYVADNHDDIVSTLLMLTSYDSSRDAARTDSIMSSINPAVRPSYLVDGFNSMLMRLVSQSVDSIIAPIPFFNLRDSLLEFKPDSKRLSVIALTDTKSGRADSIVPALKRIHDRKKRRNLQLVEFSLDRDTLTWHRSVRPDSASWQQGWVAGSIASPGIERLAVPSIPYFIVVDSLGLQTLRTTSVNRLEAYVDSCLNRQH